MLRIRRSFPVSFVFLGQRRRFRFRHATHDTCSAAARSLAHMARRLTKRTTSPCCRMRMPNVGPGHQHLSARLLARRASKPTAAFRLSRQAFPPRCPPGDPYADSEKWICCGESTSGCQRRPGRGDRWRRYSRARGVSCATRSACLPECGKILFRRISMRVKWQLSLTSC